MLSHKGSAHTPVSLNRGIIRVQQQRDIHMVFVVSQYLICTRSCLNTHGDHREEPKTIAIGYRSSGCTVFFILRPGLVEVDLFVPFTEPRWRQHAKQWFPRPAERSTNTVDPRDDILEEHPSRGQTLGAPASFRHHLAGYGPNWTGVAWKLIRKRPEDEIVDYCVWVSPPPSPPSTPSPELTLSQSQHWPLRHSGLLDHPIRGAECSRLDNLGQAFAGSPRVTTPRKGKRTLPDVQGSPAAGFAIVWTWVA